MITYYIDEIEADQFDDNYCNFMPMLLIENYDSKTQVSFFFHIIIIILIFMCSVIIIIESMRL